MVPFFKLSTQGSCVSNTAFWSWLRLGLILLVPILLSGSSLAQSKGKEYFLYNTLKVGLGVPYGGLGLNYEYGIHRYSIYGGFGYRWSRGTIQITPFPNAPDSTIDFRIEDSFNYGGGFRFHLRNNEEELQPRIGIYAGWVGNYYDRRIGLDNYNHSVYGLALTVGADFYTEKLIFDLDGILVPAGDFIFNASEHPFYSRTLFKLSLGVGLDLGDIFVLRKRKKFDIDYQ